MMMAEIDTEGYELAEQLLQSANQMIRMAVRFLPKNYREMGMVETASRNLERTAAAIRYDLGQQCIACDHDSAQHRAHCTADYCSCNGYR